MTLKQWLIIVAVILLLAVTVRAVHAETCNDSALICQAVSSGGISIWCLTTNPDGPDSVHIWCGNHDPTTPNNIFVPPYPVPTVIP